MMQLCLMTRVQLFFYADSSFQAARHDLSPPPSNHSCMQFHRQFPVPLEAAQFIIVLVVFPDMKINPKIFLLTVRDSLDPSDPKLGSYIPPSFVFDCVCVYYILSCVPPIINNKSEKITGYLKSILVILSTPFLSLDKC